MVVQNHTFLTSSVIREALIQLANEQKRPHFGLYIVRQVIFAFKNNINHPLKDEVLAVIYKNDKKEINHNNPESEAYKRNQLKIAYQKDQLDTLFSAKLLHEKQIINVIKGREELTDKIWYTALQCMDAQPC